MGITTDKYLDYMEEKEEKRWCKTHPAGFWGKDQFGQWYAQCSRGWSAKMRGENPPCEVGEND